MEENYRSTKTIVLASNEVIIVNTSLKASYTRNKQGLPILLSARLGTRKRRLASLFKAYKKAKSL